MAFIGLLGSKAHAEYPSPGVGAYMAKEKTEEKNEKNEKNAVEAQVEPTPKAPKQKEQHMGGIIRIAGRDIDDSYTLFMALTKVKGIGHSMAHALSIGIKEKHGIDPNMKLSELDEQRIANVEEVLKNPKEFGVPSFLLNRRKDRETGEDMHVIGTDVTVRVRQDVDADVKLQDWRGYRHQYGQKVRGQRNRSTGRTGETIGVTKKKEMPATAGAGAAAPAAGAEKKAAKPSPAAAAKK